MHYIRTLEGSTLEEMMMPRFRHVTFEDESAMVTVSTFLRLAWTAVPTENPTKDDVWSWVREASQKSPEEWEQLPKNSDLSTVHTPWRDPIYNGWNHVFWDTINFLQQAAMGVGHMHPPSEEILPLQHSGENNEQVIEKSWDTNVMLIWSYLAPGISVTISRFVKEDGENEIEKELRKFDASTKTEIWFLLKDTKVRFKVEGPTDAVQNGLAALLVAGLCCNREDEEGEEEDEDEDDGEDVQDEKTEDMTENTNQKLRSNAENLDHNQTAGDLEKEPTEDSTPDQEKKEEYLEAKTDEEKPEV